MKEDHATGLWGGAVVSKRPERAGLLQLLEMRHASARHQIADEVVVHPVDAEHDDVPPCLHVPRSARERAGGEGGDANGQHPHAAVHATATFKGRPSIHEGG